MNFMGSYENLLSQGPVFWVAAAAVAAGITLVVVSLTIQVRKIFARGISPFRFKALKKPSFSKNASPAHPEVKITDTGYGLKSPRAQTGQSHPAVQAVKLSDTDSTVLKGLLLRLRQAGDQLEDLQNISTPTQNAGHNSLLKQPSGNVEYLIRTGIS